MAIERVPADDGQYIHFTETVTHSHTVSSDIDLLLVIFTYSQSGVIDPSVSWQAPAQAEQPMTRETFTQGDGGLGGSIFSLANPNAGVSGDLDLASGLVGDLQYGANVFAYSFTGVDTAAPIVDSASERTTSSGQTLNAPSSGEFSGGEAGDLMFGGSSAWQAYPTTNINGQTTLDQNTYRNDALASFFKSWGTNNFLQSQAVDFGWIGGVLIAEAAAAGPNLAIRRRRM